MKSTIFMKKHLATGLLFVIFEKLFGFIFYGNLFKNAISEYDFLLREPSSIILHLVSIWEFILGFFASWSYFWIKRNIKENIRVCPFKFALLYVFLTRIIAELLNFSILDYSFTLTLCGLITSICTSLCLSAVLSLTANGLRKCPAINRNE